jgi:aspartate aminotransferase
MKKISKVAQNINDSLTLALTSKGNELKAKGVDVVSFTAGEPDFPTPKYICDAAKAALDAGFTRYTAAAGIPELRKAIAAKLRKENNLDYTPDQIIVTTGGKAAIFGAIYCLSENGAEVIVPAPYWLSYPEMAKAVGAKPVAVKTDAANDYKITARQLRAHVTPHSRILMLNSPNNPTGAMYSENELRALGEIAIEKDLTIISDEIYEKLVYDGRHVSIAALSEELKARTVVVNGFSKSYAMTGWRIGYAAGPLEVIKAMGRLQAQIVSNVNSIAQKAALAALEQDGRAIEDMRREYAKRREFLMARLADIPGIAFPRPAGAFYVLVDVSRYYGRKAGEKKITDSLTFCEACLEKANLLLIPGKPFGADWAVRLSFAVSMEDLKKGLDRFQKFLADMRT